MSASYVLSFHLIIVVLVDRYSREGGNVESKEWERVERLPEARCVQGLSLVDTEDHNYFR
ncbi:hypothetical protein BgiMline_030983, partial [Biomphalaria glabrata]